LETRGAFDAAIVFSVLTTLMFLAVRPIGAARIDSTGLVQAAVQGRRR